MHNSPIRLRRAGFRIEHLRAFLDREQGVHHIPFHQDGFLGLRGWPVDPVFFNLEERDEGVLHTLDDAAVCQTNTLDRAADLGEQGLAAFCLCAHGIDMGVLDVASNRASRPADTRSGGDRKVYTDRSARVAGF